MTARSKMLIALGLVVLIAASVAAQLYTHTELKGGGFGLVVVGLASVGLPFLAAQLWRFDSLARTPAPAAQRRGWYERTYEEARRRSWAGAGEAALLPLLLLASLLCVYILVDEFRIDLGEALEMTGFATTAVLLGLAATLALWRRPRLLLPGTLRAAYRVQKQSADARESKVGRP